ncbi:hypothetical protein [Photobacterium leiognathi]|uniref:hypothetical protein n=1 Tax=Photobacterium leiognathi TaxID=553611 RepID=UPI000D15D37D|nr:hypothetical protein [Photobacterium leiognathi]PSW55895.1 hypothetical protein C0W50_16090 [Photobacterium leiognathi subsp. mandapamensis]
MSKHSKLRRDAKRKKAKKTNTNITPKKSYAASMPVMAQFNNPFSGLSDEQRKEALTIMGDKSKEDVIESLEFLEEMLRKYDAITLIANIAFYGLTIGVSNSGVLSKESASGVEQAHVELLQAILLKIPESEVGLYPVTPDVIQAVIDKLQIVSQAFALSRMSESWIEFSDSESAINVIQEKLRSHTQMVRNWGFYSQVKTVCKEIYSNFDGLLSAKLGFTASDVIITFEALTNIMEDNLSQRFNVLKELKKTKKPFDLLLKYHQLIGQGQLEAEECARQIDISRMSTQTVFLMCMSHFDLRMADYYLIDFDKVSEATGLEPSIIKEIANLFSYSFGDLTNKESRFFFLDNPVWHKPIIVSNCKYYCILPQLFFSFALDTLDEIIEKYDKQALHKRRALYLENKIESIVKTRFPMSKVVSGVKWNHGDAQYETDLIAFIDSYAIIIEAKSHKISKPALRGAPDRIRRHLQEVLIDPSIQSYRLEQKLNEIRDANLRDDLVENLPININDIKKVLRVSVSLEDFATLQSNLRLFKTTGWLPDEFVACPSMNIADFETLFDLLEHPVQIVHYLLRRTELEGNYKFVGDELDFLGLYLSTFLNVGDAESEIFITDMSEPIDLYYMSKEKGIDVEKPKPKTSRLFRDIFHTLEQRATPRWSEIGCILNRFSPDDQIKMAKHIKDLSKIVQRNWRNEDHKNSLIYSPPDSSEYALAVVLFKNENSEKRYDFIDNASLMGLEPDHVKYCLVIAVNIDQEDHPYRFIGLMEKKTSEVQSLEEVANVS